MDHCWYCYEYHPWCLYCREVRRFRDENERRYPFLWRLRLAAARGREASDGR